MYNAQATPGRKSTKKTTIKPSLVEKRIDVKPLD
jgi:hypothetical protein